ncbi:MAG TPA: TetR family transcriptional regulator [bacterium]|nr:TetR family transcriptional regulator [bacterium]HQG44119.1 TetR family transcriptional regulator [bacterium]HQI49649.1 TetR family transcriptional regulator [bacterium]HQJ64348.1 TetR family transcriptional regulator [bacterium]HQJ65460.1 TetR family transcriptional regulator [bacterium]
MSDRENMRDRIKQAAAEVFSERGFDGARMQEIADRAGANKAMIYYYFNSKEALFTAIFSENFTNLLKLFSSILQVEAIDPKVVIPQLVHLHLDFLNRHPELPRMIVREIHSGNPVVEKLVRSNFRRFSGPLQALRDEIPAAIRNGRLRKVDPLQTVWNLVALNIFVFIVQPILAAAFPEAFSDKARMLAEREKAIVDLMLYGLIPRQEE